MKINKKISALLCSVVICSHNGQVSKTSASLVGYSFSVVAVKEWLKAASYYHSIFIAGAIDLKGGSSRLSWFVDLYHPRKTTVVLDDKKEDVVVPLPWSKGLKSVAEKLFRFDALPSSVMWTYLAREEFRKEKENNKRVLDDKTCVDSRNDKSKKDSNTSK